MKFQNDWVDSQLETSFRFFFRFAFVDFESIAAAQTALQILQSTVFRERRLAINYAVAPRPERSARARMLEKDSAPTRMLYLQNLPFDLTDTDIKDFFVGIRGITDVRVAVDRNTGMLRGFAHAEFVDIESASAAKEILMNKPLLGRPVRIAYGFTKRQADLLARRSSEELETQS